MDNSDFKRRKQDDASGAQATRHGNIRGRERRSDSAEATNYAVGYRKPPKHAQFKKGRSGNPRGRPRGARNLATDLSAELREIVMVREGGRSRPVSKQRALIKSLTDKALKGDARAMDTLLALHARIVPEEPEPKPNALIVKFV